jgi:superfamily I DNA/RNA helicase
MYHRLAADVSARNGSAFDFVVVDESQDVTPAQLRFLAALAGKRPNALFFAGDLGQRIFQQPFSWRALGVDIRGRSRTLQVNYRTSHQIRSQADRLLGAEVSDVDGNTETRKGTVSAFNGPQPKIQSFAAAADETAAVAAWIGARMGEGFQAREIGVFVRSQAELARAQAAVQVAGAQANVLDERIAVAGDRVAISTMHLAKGLEFRAVAVMACDEEVCPLQSRIEAVSDEADLEEVYATERHLLYVACTRARERLLVTSVDEAEHENAPKGQAATDPRPVTG